MFKISVIMPLYNVEKFVEEAIDSIIDQTIGFEDNIKLILVNDGSVDNTEEICKKYLQKFPENIKYIYKENGGVSVARNTGMQHLEGEFVVFFDGDDRWGKDAFERMVMFLEKYDEEIDAVASRSCYFDRRSGFENPLDYVFASDRVVNIDEEYWCIQPMINNVMFRKAALEGIVFDSKLKIHEDTMFFSQVLVKKRKFGVLRSATFFYRKRSDNSSAMDSSRENLAWYFDVPKYCYEGLINLSQETFGEVIPYFQFLIMAIMQYAIKRPISDRLTCDEKEAYRKSISDILKNIDDRIIREQKNLNFAYKICALNLKYNCDILEKSSFDDSHFKFGNLTIMSVNAAKRLVLDNIQITKDKIQLTGNTHFGLFRDYLELGVIAGDEGKHIPCELFDIPEEDLYGIIEGKVRPGTGFKAEIPLYNDVDLVFSLKNIKEKMIYPKLTLSHELQQCASKNTIYKDKNVIVLFKKNRLLIRKNNIKNRCIARMYMYI